MKNRSDLNIGNPNVSEDFRYIHKTNSTTKNIQEQKSNSSEIINEILAIEQNEKNKFENKNNYKNIKLSDEHLESFNIIDKEILDNNNICCKKEGNKMKNYEVSNGNKQLEIEKNKKRKNNIYDNYVSKEKCQENIEKINDKINELLKRVFKVYRESNKKQYFSRLFQMRDINCIFSCMFFSFLIIFFIMNEHIGVLLSLLLLVISMQLKFSRSYMTLLNSIVGVIIISIFTIFSTVNTKDENTSANVPKNGLNTNSNKKLLALEAIICYIYAFTLFIYMFTIKSNKKYKMQHLWIYHNIVNFFNLFDVCLIFCFGLLAFFFIFSCFGEILFIIMSFILFSSSLFIYCIRKYSNIIIVILQTILLVTNSVIASASLSKDISSKSPANDKSKELYKIYLFYMVFLIFFFVFHVLYIYYIFFSNENTLSKWFSERKVYYSNIHPYMKKDENKNVYFKYDKYVLSLDDHSKILNVQKKDSREINIDFKKYIYSDLHLYKHILLKTAIDIKYSSNAYDDNELLKNRKNYEKNRYLSEEKKKLKNVERCNSISKKNTHHSNDFIIDISESLSDISEIHDHTSNKENKRNCEQRNINKGLDFLFKKTSTIHDKISKNKTKVDYLKNNVFYFTNCKNTNYCTSSIFCSKYTYIIGVLLDNYDELIFYLKKKKFFSSLIESTNLEHENLNKQIIPYDHQKEQQIHKDLCLINKISTFSIEMGPSEDVNQNFSLKEENSQSNMIKDIVISLEQNYSNNIEESCKSEFDKLYIVNTNPDELNESNESSHFSNYKHDIMNNHWKNTNISSTLRKSNDCCSFYLLNSNLNNCNSLISNYDNDYIKIPIYSSSKLSFDENKNKEENCFWYYYPGIIARVYKEWLKCKNLDYKKFNNDFYYLFSNSNNLNEFLKSNISNIEKEDEIKLFDISQVLSSNRNIINKIKTSYSRRCPSFLSEDLCSNSLNGVISNFLTDRNTNFDSLCFLSSKTLQSFFEDSNIKQFLSSLYNDKKELINEEKSSKRIKNLILELDKKILQNKFDYDTKSINIINMQDSSASNCENSDKIRQKNNKEKNYESLNNKSNSEKEKEEKEHSNIERKMECNNIKNDKKCKFTEDVNLNDLLNYAETLILQNKKNDANHKNLINNSLCNLSNFVELDIKDINSCDEILSNFIKNLQKERSNVDSERNENDNKEKVNSLKTKDESYSDKKKLYEEKQLNHLINKEDKLNNQIILSNTMKIVDTDNNKLKENHQDSNYKLERTNKEELVDKYSNVDNEKKREDKKNDLSESYGQKVNKEFNTEINLINNKTENSSEYSGKKKCKNLNELSYDSLNKYINSDLKNEKNRIKRDTLIEINSSCSLNTDEDNKINLLDSSRKHYKNNDKSIKKNQLEFSNNEKINNLTKRKVLNNNFENFSSYFITEKNSSNFNEELIMSNENDIINNKNTKDKYCYNKKIEDYNFKKQKYEKQFNLNNLSSINLDDNEEDSNNNYFDTDNKLKKDEKINTQDLKSKLYNDEIKENIFISHQNEINYNLINNSTVLSNKSISNTKKFIDKEEESNITRELNLEMIDNLKKRLHENNMNRINSKEDIQLFEKKIKSKKDDDTEDKLKQEFQHNDKEYKEINCELKSPSVLGIKNISRSKTSVEKYCIHSNEINYSSNNELSHFNDENNKIDNYNDDDYENDFGYNSEYIKLIEEKNYSNNFSNDPINNSFDPESYELLENLKKYISLGSSKKVFNNDNFSNISLLESINKYLENNKQFNINIFNELIFDENKKKDEDLRKLPLNICKTKQNEEVNNEKLNNKNYIDTIKEKGTEYYDISDENKQLNYHDKNLNIHLSSNSYDEPIINFLNTYIFENNNKLMKNAILKIKNFDNLKPKNVNSNSNGELNISSEISHNRNENNNNNNNNEEKNHEQENNIIKGTHLKKKNDIRNSSRKINDKQYPYDNSNNSCYSKLSNDKKGENHYGYDEYENEIGKNKYYCENIKDLSKIELETSLNKKMHNFDRLNNYEDYKDNINDEVVECKKDNKKSNDERTCDKYHCINDFENLNKSETFLKYFSELRNKFKGNEGYPEEKCIRKADIKLTINNNDSSCENLRENENYINYRESKHINDAYSLNNEKQKNIYHSNKNIFNKTFGFQNGVSETSSSSDNNLTGLLIGSDIFYESFVYKSLGDIENLKRRIDEYKKKGVKNKENEELNEKESFIIKDIVDNLESRKNTNEEDLKYNENMIHNDFKDNNDKLTDKYNDISNKINSISNVCNGNINNNNNNNYDNIKDMKHKKEKYKELNSRTENEKSIEESHSNYSITSSKNIKDKIEKKSDPFSPKNVINTCKIKNINTKENNEQLKNENDIYIEKNHIKYNNLNNEINVKSSETAGENNLKNNFSNNEVYKNSNIHKYCNKENNINNDNCSIKSNLQNKMEKKENFKISVNGKILNNVSNKMSFCSSNNNDNNNNNNNSINNRSIISDLKKNVFNDDFKKEEKDNNVFNNTKISEENENFKTKILTYYQTEENVVKCKEYNKDKKCNNSEKEMIYDTPIPSSNANEYLIHKNVYNEKSSNDIRIISSNSFFVDNDSSLISKNSIDSGKSFSDIFVKGSNLSKLSDNLKTEELKNAYKDAYNNLYEQYQQKTESNINSDECNMKYNRNKSKKKKIVLQKEKKIKNEMKKINKSMSNTRITLTTTTIDNLEDSDYIGNNFNIKNFKTSAKFLKQNRYNQLNEKKEKEEEKKKKNRYYDKNNQSFYNSDYIQHFNTILNTYSWSPDNLNIKKNNYLFKKSNTYLDVASTEDSDPSGISNFVKDALYDNSSSNKSSNNYENLKRNKKKWKSERNLYHFLKRQKRKKYIQKFRSADILKNIEKESKESFIELIQEGNIFPSIRIKNKRTFNFLEDTKSSFVENENSVKQCRKKLEINDYENYSNMYENILNSSLNTCLRKENNSENLSSNILNSNVNVNNANILSSNIFDEYSQEYIKEKHCMVNEEIKNENNGEYSMNNKNSNLKVSKRYSNYHLNKDNNRDKNIKLSDCIYSNNLFRNNTKKEKNNNNFLPFSNSNQFIKSNDEGIVNSCITNYTKNSKKMNILNTNEENNVPIKKKISKINHKVIGNIDNIMNDSNYELKNYLTNDHYQNNSSSIISFNEQPLNKAKSNNSFPKSDSIYINSNFSFESKYNENILKKHKTSEKVEIETENNMKEIVGSSIHNKECNEKKNMTNDKENATPKKNVHNNVRVRIDDDKKKKIVEELKKKFHTQNILSVIEAKNSTKEKKSEEKPSELDNKKKSSRKRIHIDQKKLEDAIKNFKNYKKMNERNSKTSKLKKKKKYIERPNNNIPIKFPYSLDNFCNVINSEEEINDSIFMNTSK
ncbi:conserved Plasmodium protein, unknown function [Plasmodium relictum]|uniref:Uncharacterized protein n=1 Tax=Plasmodium relictum TaxID=85471 RepID=A0A1J1H4K7_PLARL|nr:conserved Plasmodium protein, unknown function [Plasmodium relictum]CRG98371.1 conserved Plasmodium protein, unknown function [Plasmodium relictum]